MNVHWEHSIACGVHEDGVCTCKEDAPVSVPAGSSRSPAEGPDVSEDQRAAARRGAALGGHVPAEEALDRRLKACLPRYRELNSPLWDAIQGARNRLDSLTAQVERLERENDSLRMIERATDHARVNDNRYLIGRAESAEAEVSRLTGLLEHTTEGLRELLRDDLPSGSYGWLEARRKARALLAASSRPPGDTPVNEVEPEGEQT